MLVILLKLYYVEYSTKKTLCAFFPFNNMSRKKGKKENP